MPPRILALHCAVPERAYGQKEVYRDFFAPLFRENPKAREIFENSRIEKRHAVLDLGFYSGDRTIEERNRVYVEGALHLGEKVVLSCLGEIGAGARDLDDFIVVSCTGYSNPGLEILLAKRLGMRENLRRTAIGGMGCYGAFPGLARACESLAVRPESRVLLLTVEICSATLQMNASMENVVASALFADGAAAVILGDGQAPVQAKGRPFPRVLDFETRTSCDTIDDMGFFLTASGFRIQLSARVPLFIREGVADLTDRLLARNGLTRKEVRFWAIHPGGAKILDYVQERLGLAEEDLRFSRDILAGYGNMSSPTVMFILDEISRRGGPRPGDRGFMLGFGPGLTMAACLLQW
ncbi:MAG: type III polyketide synthase [Candidatus Tectomicrobia bacterium]|nr:type III polyketide synthase [Candidatus Tectomicrobia bacterium]